MAKTQQTPKKIRAYYDQWTDELIFAAVERLAQGWTVSNVANWINKEDFGRTVTREKLYFVVFEAYERGFLSLHAPRDANLSLRLKDVYGHPRDAHHVVPASGALTHRRVAEAGADLLLKRIREVGKRKEMVHVGIGSGNTTRIIAQRLAAALRVEHGLPDITLHAISTGISVSDPRTSSTAFLALFYNARPLVLTKALIATPIVTVQEFKRLKRQAQHKELFAAAKTMDIVITSLASASDPDGELNGVVSNEEYAEYRKFLQDHGWQGDVQYRPYSAEGPIVSTRGVRPVTLFELSDLVKLAATKHKHVILVGGPCGQCQKPRTDALRPLMQNPKLALWSDLVLDSATARDLLDGEARLVTKLKAAAAT